jgi:hypothetical protein
MTGLRRSHFARPVAPVEVPGRCTGLRNWAARLLDVSSPYLKGCDRRFRHQLASGENAEGAVGRECPQGRVGVQVPASDTTRRRWPRPRPSTKVQ